MCFFENGIISGFILCLITLVGGFIIYGLIATAIFGDSDTGLGCGTIIIVLAFLGFIVGEYDEGHPGHAFLLVSPIIACIAYFVVSSKKDEKLKQEAEEKIPEIINNFIEENHILSPLGFHDYLISADNLKKFKKISFENPDYQKKESENEKLKSEGKCCSDNKFKKTISFDEYSTQKYIERINKMYVEDLKSQIQMYDKFTYKQLYSDFVHYQDFFKKDDESIDLDRFIRVSKPIVSTELTLNHFTKSGDLYIRFKSESQKINLSK